MFFEVTGKGGGKIMTITDRFSMDHAINVNVSIVGLTTSSYCVDNVVRREYMRF